MGSTRRIPTEKSVGGKGKRCEIPTADSQNDSTKRGFNKFVASKQNNRFTTWLFEHRGSGSGGLSCVGIGGNPRRTLNVYDTPKRLQLPSSRTDFGVDVTTI
eukprot:scaffold1248_cov170-Amphora_coffeaeformis.AAC.18